MTANTILCLAVIQHDHILFCRVAAWTRRQHFPVNEINTSYFEQACFGTFCRSEQMKFSFEYFLSYSCNRAVFPVAGAEAMWMKRPNENFWCSFLTNSSRGKYLFLRSIPLASKGDSITILCFTADVRGCTASLAAEMRDTFDKTKQEYEYVRNPT